MKKRWSYCIPHAQPLVQLPTTQLFLSFFCLFTCLEILAGRGTAREQFCQGPQCCIPWQALSSGRRCDHQTACSDGVDSDVYGLGICIVSCMTAAIQLSSGIVQVTVFPDDGEHYGWLHLAAAALYSPSMMAAAKTWFERNYEHHGGAAHLSGTFIPRQFTDLYGTP